MPGHPVRVLGEAYMAQFVPWKERDAWLANFRFEFKLVQEIQLLEDDMFDSVFDVFLEDARKP
jgi:hypothetical protein